MRVLRWVLLAVGVIAVGAGAFVGWAVMRVTHKIQIATLAPAGPGDVAHGQALARQTLLCAECHGQSLGGGVVMNDTPGVVSAPDLTRRRSFEDWDRAVRHGVAADGRPLILMPADGYSKLSVQDLRDLVAYLDQLPAAPQPIPPTKLSPLGYVLTATGQLHVPALELDHASVANTVDVAAAPKTGRERGVYLIDVSGCRGCHGPSLEGRSMGPSMPTAPALTATALQERGQPAFFTAMTEGKRHDGQTLNPIMPWKTFGAWPREDLDALWTALTADHP